LSNGARPPLDLHREHVVACGVLSGAGAVVIERTHTRIRPDNVGARQVFPEITVGGGDQILDLGLAGLHIAGVALVILVGCADQRKIVFIRNGEENSSVRILEEIAALVIVKLARNDMRTLHKPHLCQRI
jgi:hypothetical protein